MAEINEDEWNLMNVDSSSIAGINTHALQEKSNACDNLSVYISSMNEAFFPFIPQVLPVCKSLIEYEYLGEIRKYGAAIMSGILQSADSHIKLTKESRVPIYELFNHFFPLLFEAIQHENDPDVQSSLALSLFEILTAVGKEAIKSFL